MKKLNGKKCANCGSTSIVIAAQGEVLLVRCLACTGFSICCPEDGCPGQLRDTAASGYREQHCNRCDYETEYITPAPPPFSEAQESLPFDERKRDA